MSGPPTASTRVLAAYRTTLSVLAAQLTLTAPLLLGMIVYCSLFPSGALAEPSELAFQPLMVSLGYTLTALACGGILVRSLLGTPSAIVVHPLSRRIGRYSYAMYLLHMPIWFFCAMTLKGAFDAGLLDAGLTRFRAPFLFVVVLTLTYLAAALSWRILEGPLNALKERFPYSGPARAGLATRADSAAVR